LNNLSRIPIDFPYLVTLPQDIPALGSRQRQSGNPGTPLVLGNRLAGCLRLQTAAPRGLQEDRRESTRSWTVVPFKSKCKEVVQGLVLYCQMICLLRGFIYRDDL
jgi:hypothetical protein